MKKNPSHGFVLRTGTQPFIGPVLRFTPLTSLIHCFANLEQDELANFFGGYEKADIFYLTGETDILISRYIVMSLAGNISVMRRQPDSAAPAVHCLAAPTRQARIGTFNGLAKM